MYKLQQPEVLNRSLPTTYPRGRRTTSTTAALSKKSGGKLLYYTLLGYTFVFYSQIGGRLPFLAPFRVELLLGVFALALAISKIMKKEVRWDENRLNRAAITFLFACFATVPFAFVRMRALEQSVMILKFFAIYLMIITAIDNRAKLEGFIKVYLAMVALVFVQPFLLSLVGMGFVYNNHMMRLGGVTGYFAHPNMLAIVTASSLPFFYYYMRDSKSKKVKIVCLLLLLISVRVIMLTQSRTGFVGVAAFVFLVWMRSKRKVMGAIACLVMAAVGWTFAPQQTRDRFLTLFRVLDVMTTDRDTWTEEEDDTLGSMESRLELTQRTLIAFAENPVLGLGLGCFASYNGRRWGLWFPPHNTFLQVLAEAGILGFITLMFVIYRTYQNLLRVRRESEQLNTKDGFFATTADAVMASYLTFMVVALFGIELVNNHWWVMGGLSVVLLRVLSHERALLDSDNLGASAKA